MVYKLLTTEEKTAMQNRCENARQNGLISICGMNSQSYEFAVQALEDIPALLEENKILKLALELETIRRDEDGRPTLDRMNSTIEFAHSVLQKANSLEASKGESK